MTKPRFNSWKKAALGTAAVVAIILLFQQPAAAEGFWSQFEDPDDGRFDARPYRAEKAERSPC